MPAKGGRIKVTLVGSRFTGKTALVSAALDQIDGATDTYIHETIRILEWTIQDGAQGKPVDAVLWDTSGVYENNRFEVLKYPNADILILAYAVDSPESFDLIEEQWLPEVKHFCPDAPILLIGLRKDTRDNENRSDGDAGSQYVSRKCGEELARQIGAVAFRECSSATGDGVEDVFETLAEVVSSHQMKVGKRPKSGRKLACRIL